MNVDQVLKKESVNVINDIFTRITPDIFRSFLMEKNASKKCLSCGSEELRIPTTKQGCDEGDYVWFQAVNPQYDIEPSNAQYTVVCTNCGCINHYHSMIIINWYSKQNNDGVENE